MCSERYFNEYCEECYDNGVMLAENCTTVKFVKAANTYDQDLLEMLKFFICFFIDFSRIVTSEFLNQTFVDNFYKEENMIYSYFG